MLLLSKMCPPAKSETLLAFPGMGTWTPAFSLFFFFPIFTSAVVDVLSGNKPVRDWRCLCSLPKGSSHLGTRNLSGLNGEMVVATAGLCLSAINKDSQVGCKGESLG